MKKAQLRGPKPAPAKAGNVKKTCGKRPGGGGGQEKGKEKDKRKRKDRRRTVCQFSRSELVDV